jgi:hypothetical protein
MAEQVDKEEMAESVQMEVLVQVAETQTAEPEEMDKTAEQVGTAVMVE